MRCVKLNGVTNGRARRYTNIAEQVSIVCGNERTLPNKSRYEADMTEHCRKSPDMMRK